MYLSETDYACDNAFALAVGPLVKKSGKRVYTERLVRTYVGKGSLLHSEGGHGTTHVWKSELEAEFLHTQDEPHVSASCVFVALSQLLE